VILLSVAFLTTLYHVSVPVRSPWIEDVPGALVALAMWVLGSFLLRLYLTNTVEGPTIYGSLAPPVPHLLWIGASASAMLERSTPPSTASGRPPPRPPPARPTSGCARRRSPSTSPAPRPPSTRTARRTPTCPPSSPSAGPASSPRRTSPPGCAPTRSPPTPTSTGATRPTRRSDGRSAVKPGCRRVSPAAAPASTLTPWTFSPACWRARAPVGRS